MHGHCSHYEWKGNYWCHHGAQQTRCWWILKEWSGGEWTGDSFLITGCLYWLLVYLPGWRTQTKSNRHHLIGLRNWKCAVEAAGFYNLFRHTNPVWGSHPYPDLQGKIANFSPLASCLWPVYLEAWLGALSHHYESSTYNPLSSDIFFLSCFMASLWL